MHQTVVLRLKGSAPNYNIINKYVVITVRSRNCKQGRPSGQFTADTVLVGFYDKLLIVTAFC